MIRAVGKNILVRKDKKENKNGSLILTSKDNEDYYAEVISIGSQVEIIIEETDIVLVRSFEKKVIQENDKEQYLLVNENSILGVKNV